MLKTVGFISAVCSYHFYEWKCASFWNLHFARDISIHLYIKSCHNH